MTEILSVKEFEETLGAFRKSHSAYEVLDLCVVLMRSYRALHERCAGLESAKPIRAWLTRDEEDHEFPYMIWDDVEVIRTSLRLEGGRLGRCWRAKTSNPVPFDMNESAIPPELRLTPGGGPVAVELHLRKAAE